MFRFSKIFLFYFVYSIKKMSVYVIESKTTIISKINNYFTYGLSETYFPMKKQLDSWLSDIIANSQGIYSLLKKLCVMTRN